jgi:hypothetical protein
MNKRRGTMRGVVAAALVALVGTVLMAPTALMPEARGQSPDQVRAKRILREITVMEKVIDQMLLDSKNLLVYSHENNTRGLYLDEFGILFSFQASLVDRDDDRPWPNVMKGFKFEESEDGTIIVIPTPPKAPNPPEPPSGGVNRPKTREAPQASSGESARSWLDRKAGRRAKLYEAGKEEIIDTLVEYGDSMNSLRDTQWLGIAAFLRNSDFFIDNRISRLVVKARMSDIRAYHQGKLNRDQIVAKVVQEEY